MPILAPADLARKRLTAAESLVEVVTIQRSSTIVDAAGGDTVTWATVATTVGRVAPAQLQPDERGAGGNQAQAIGRWHITLPVATDVRPTDRLIVAGVTYEVIGARAPRTVEIVRHVEAVTVA